MIKTYQIHISGRVQGVGFRPFIFNLSENFGLKGFVSNNEKGVIIQVQGIQEKVENFYNQIALLKPKSSQIISSTMVETPIQETFEKFTIRTTPENLIIDIPLTPDFATCPNCEEELLDEKNRRYFYPFTTCTQCGPRYAITEKFPFERENTSISQWEMCPDCLQEYQNPTDIRFHSQTNTCPDCGIKTKLTDNEEKIISKNNKEIFTFLAEKLRQGKIIAVKNTSGYLLLCDATNPGAVKELRKRKNRPTKPFAVLFPNMEKMSEYLHVKDFHKEEFLSPEAPIIIIKVKDSQDLAIEEIAPNMETVGALYPYTGILKLIAHTFKKPVIATSGNIHGSPICSNEKEAVETLHPVADFFLHHTLPILHPQDDSVIKFSEKFHQKIVLRRSRGYAPNYLFSEELEKKNPEKEKILCLGGDLKNTFTAVPNNHCYISEYIGDLANFETYLRFEKTIQSYQNFFSFQPELVISDQHPLYESRKVKNQLTSNSIKEYNVQHHEAHFAAILGEHQLWESKEKILGVIWDGTGFFSENEIWGSEFFIYKNQTFHHKVQLDSFSWILGNKMSKTPKLSALSISENDEVFRPYFTENEWKLYTKLISQGEIKTSSMGRLFDAVSFILGYTQPIYFEGEAAMLLEKLAVKAWRKYENEFTDYLGNEMIEQKIPTKKLLNRILTETQTQPVEKIALNFHYTLIKIVEKITRQNQVSSIAFSGGVFQNSVLVDLAIQVLKPNFKLYFHEKLSPNDENISFGQLNYYLNIKTN